MPTTNTNLPAGAATLQPGIKVDDIKLVDKDPQVNGVHLKSKARPKPINTAGAKSADSQIEDGNHTPDSPGEDKEPESPSIKTGATAGSSAAGSTRTSSNSTEETIPKEFIELMVGKFERSSLKLLITSLDELADRRDTASEKATKQLYAAFKANVSERNKESKDTLEQMSSQCMDTIIGRLASKSFVENTVRKIAEEQTQKLTAIDSKVTVVDQKLGVVSKKVDICAEKLAILESEFKKHEKTFEEINKLLDLTKIEEMVGKDEKLKKYYQSFFVALFGCYLTSVMIVKGQLQLAETTAETIAGAFDTIAKGVPFLGTITGLVKSATSFIAQVVVKNNANKICNAFLHQEQAFDFTRGIVSCICIHESSSIKSTTDKLSILSKALALTGSYFDQSNVSKLAEKHAEVIIQELLEHGFEHIEQRNHKKWAEKVLEKPLNLAEEKQATATTDVAKKPNFLKQLSLKAKEVEASTELKTENRSRSTDASKIGFFRASLDEKSSKKMSRSILSNLITDLQKYVNTNDTRSHNLLLADKIIFKLEQLFKQEENPYYDQVFAVISTEIKMELAVREAMKDSEKTIKTNGGKFYPAIAKLVENKKLEELKGLCSSPVKVLLSRDQIYLFNGIKILKSYTESWNLFSGNKDVAIMMIKQLNRLEKTSKDDITQIILDVIKKQIELGRLAKDFIATEERSGGDKSLSANIKRGFDIDLTETYGAELIEYEKQVKSKQQGQTNVLKV